MWMSAMLLCSSFVKSSRKFAVSGAKKPAMIGGQPSALGGHGVPACALLRRALGLGVVVAQLRNEQRVALDLGDHAVLVRYAS
jgi:hypothetical protein